MGIYKKSWGDCSRMKNKQVYDIDQQTIRDLILPSDKVAHVQIGNPLEHALLVLIKTGYSAIPVLDPSYYLKGLISKTLILDFTLGLERIEFEKLDDHVVEEVMDKENVPCIEEGEDFLKALKLTINHNFLCVVNKEGYFTGILPRSAILKFLNHYLRQPKKESIVQK